MDKVQQTLLVHCNDQLVANNLKEHVVRVLKQFYYVVLILAEMIDSLSVVPDVCARVCVNAVIVVKQKQNVAIAVASRVHAVESSSAISLCTQVIRTNTIP